MKLKMKERRLIETTETEEVRTRIESQTYDIYSEDESQIIGNVAFGKSSLSLSLYDDSKEEFDPILDGVCGLFNIKKPEL